MGNDITGLKFNHLTAICRRFDIAGGRNAYWEFECDCEAKTKKVIRRYAVEHGIIKSCGCKQRTERNLKHDGTHTRLYRVWHDMKQRCYNPNNQDYTNYGGRGIVVCPEWMGDDGFANFRKWSYENKYDENAEPYKCTLGRENNNLGYSPDNCRWVDMECQQNNRRNTRQIQAFGEVHSIAQWARLWEISPSSLWKSLFVRGLEPEDALVQCQSRRKNANRKKN